jgi:hypothetical protein
MRGPHRRRRPNGARSALGLATILGTAVFGLGLAADASAGTMPALALSTSTSSPGAIFDAIVYRCAAGAIEEPAPVTTADPGLAGTGPGDSTIARVACVAWARRRRTTT